MRRGCPDPWTRAPASVAGPTMRVPWAEPLLLPMPVPLVLAAWVLRSSLLVLLLRFVLGMLAMIGLLMVWAWPLRWRRRPRDWRRPRRGARARWPGARSAGRGWGRWPVAALGPSRMVVSCCPFWAGAAAGGFVAGWCSALALGMALLGSGQWTRGGGRLLPW